MSGYSSQGPLGTTIVLDELRMAKGEMAAGGGLTVPATMVGPGADGHVIIFDAAEENGVKTGALVAAAHAVGGAVHTADTLAHLNTKVSDATLIDTGDVRLSNARTPLAHNQSAATITTGTLPVARGGTGVGTFASGGVLYGNITGGVLVTASGASDAILAGGGGTPVFSTNPTLGQGLVTKGQAGLQLNPFDTGAGQTAEIRFVELAANGTHYVGAKSADALAGNQIYTLPATDGAVDGFVLSSDGNGVLAFNRGWMCASLTPTIISTPPGGVHQVRLNPSGAPGGHHFHIRGTTDIRQMLVSGFSGQTAPIVEFTSAGGNFTFDNAGDVILNTGDLFVGTGKLQLTSGNLNINAGDLTISNGKIALTDSGGLGDTVKAIINGGIHSVVKRILHMDFTGAVEFDASIAVVDFSRFAAASLNLSSGAVLTDASTVHIVGPPAKSAGDGSITNAYSLLIGSGRAKIPELEVDNILIIPNDAAPTIDAVGKIAIDTTITDHTGALKFHDGTEELTVVAMPTANLSTTDNDVVKYDAAANEFTMGAVTGGGGALAYTSKMELISAPASPNTWTNKDLSGGSFNVPANAICEILIENTSTNQERNVGVRPNGSSLIRSIDLHESEGGGTNVITIFVEADASSIIEIFAENTSDVNHTLIGFLS